MSRSSLYWNKFVELLVKQNKTYLIVGQGLAGTILAHHFLDRNLNFQILDSHNTHFTSSFAAGGIFNPVTGRKLERTWLADVLFDYLPSFYQNLEKKLGVRFFSQMPLFRPFANEEMKNWLLARKAEIDHSYLNWSDQGVWVNKAGWVDVPLFLLCSKAHFQDLGIYSERIFHENDLESFEKVIFCEGFHGQKNPYWAHLEFLPAKGELLKFKSMQPDASYIQNKNGFILPLGQDLFKVGATYQWNDLGSSSNPASLLELKTKLNSFQIDQYEELEVYVGVRPATQDRRPYVGFHPTLPLGIFNGFGSKGVSLMPYFAHQFVDELLGKKMIHSEASIHRFSHLFST